MEFVYKSVSRLRSSTAVLIIFSLIYFFQQVKIPQIYAKYFGVYDPHQIPVFLFFVLYTWMWFLLLPALTNKFIYRENLKEMGLVFPERKWFAAALILVALCLMVPWIIYFTQLPSFEVYSLHGLSNFQFIVMNFILFPGFYLGEEFFFRGFLFLGLWKRIGWHSFWLTDIIFTLVHFGKPPLEILLCIPASIIFNALTLWTRSIFPAVLVHSTMGIVMSVFVTYQIKVG